MAKRYRFKRKARSFKRGFFKKSSRRSSGGSVGTLIGGLMAFGWGKFRPAATNAAAPVINMIPAGDYSDEVFWGGLGLLADKGYLGNNKYIKEAGHTMVRIEAYRAGAVSNTGAKVSGGNVI